MKTTLVRKTVVILTALTAIGILAGTDLVGQDFQGRTYQAEVIKPMDGDLMMIRIHGERRVRRLQLIGVDAPEASSREHIGQEPWGTRARQYSVVKLTRKMVTIEEDVRTNDKATLLGYMWLDGQLVNEDIIRQGYALAVSEVPNIRYVERLRAAQAEAREAQRGIWSAVSPLEQSPEEFREQASSRKKKYSDLLKSLTLPEYREGCIIGNKNTKKYHTPQSRFYKAAITGRHSVFFATPADAEKAGFTLSQ